MDQAIRSAAQKRTKAVVGQGRAPVWQRPWTTGLPTGRSVGSCSAFPLLPGHPRPFLQLLKPRDRTGRLGSSSPTFPQTKQLQPLQRNTPGPEPCLQEAHFKFPGLFWRVGCIALCSRRLFRKENIQAFAPTSLSTSGGQHPHRTSVFTSEEAWFSLEADIYEQIHALGDANLTDPGKFLD